MSFSSADINPDRIFYKCPNYSATGCQFFQWVDTINPALLRGNDGVAEGQEAQENGRVLEERMDRILDQLKWLEKLVCVCVWPYLFMLCF